MNSARRAIIATAINNLGNVRSQIEDILGEEQEAFDNMPEGLQQGVLGEKVQGAISSLESAISAIEEAESALEEASA